ncbi:EAL domain-containing protein [Methylovorus menthalis]|uniref:EAL and HDOD domain-containing protein n=1 Tax=Methylovorus menthalis TaxID=1002227 RepID=UPI001E5E31BD|nr:EAL domain-containing protein [Methylovorus menthalis]MCB4809827.1 EAL domain-containing protein [Methylovorus menthalis]
MSSAVIEPFGSGGADVFLGRQPILTANRKIIAYELLFRSEASLSADVVDDVLATSTVIVNMLSEFGLELVLGNEDAFLNVSASLLMSETLELLPPERVILEILEDVPINAQIVERCAALKEMGFRIALDDFLYRPEYDHILPLVDIVKVDLTLTPLKHMAPSLTVLRKHGHIQLLAEKVQNEDEFEAFKKLGFELFQGYFFAQPVILQGKKPQPNQMTLMRIMGMLISDANLQALEEPFKQSPDLSVSLLRLVNSVGISGGRQQEIGSIRQAIAVLGQRQLLRWVQLLMYVSPEAGNASNLMQQVASRARLMELIALKLQSPEPRFSDQAFMVGMLSLVDAVLQVPIEKILNEIGLMEHLKQAILAHEGPLGQLLQLAQEIERTDFEAVRADLHALGISVGDFTAIQLQAMQWAAELNKQAV